MKIEKVVFRNEWRGIRSLSLRQFVSTLIPRPLWLTWAKMYTYRVQAFNFFKTGTISIILSVFKNWKFKQRLIKMIARWMTWQDFPLKEKLYLFIFRQYFVTCKPLLVMGKTQALWPVPSLAVVIAKFVITKWIISININLKNGRSFWATTY